MLLKLLSHVNKSTLRSDEKAGDLFFIKIKV